jgi:hypothetical protein
MITDTPNPLDGLHPVDPTGGGGWILLAAAALAFGLVWLVWTGLVDGDWTRGRLIAVLVCVVGIVALWPLGGLVDTQTAPLGALALHLRPLALIIGAAYPLYLSLQGVGRR